MDTPNLLLLPAWNYASTNPRAQSSSSVRTPLSPLRLSATMDDASADLILALQIQDLADLVADHDDEGVEGDTLSDGQMARDLYREELHNNAAIISDFRFGEKLGKAAGEEPPSPVISATPTFDQVLVKSFGPCTIGARSSTEDESSYHHWDAHYHECITCMDEFPACHLITAPCGDRYCKTCIGQLFNFATKDESLFPPRCCRQPIPLETATPMLTGAQVQSFLEKRVEFDTPNRTYCHNTTCGAFVAPDNISGEIAVCTCGAWTCIVCRSAAHEDECPEDPAYASLMAFAAAQRYQTCQQCKRLVELSIGCNHMTCLCGAEFCYVCGTTWKQCLCPCFDEGHLLAQAEAIVDRAPVPRMGEPVIPRHELIQQAAQELQENHECTHEGFGGWQMTTQRHLMCENCFQTLPRFLLECRQCHLRACVRCTRNRL